MNLIDRESSMLVVIDVQDRLMPHISDSGKTMKNIVKLLKFAKIVGLPLILTEQEKLGTTAPEIKAHAESAVVKKEFNCLECGEFLGKLRALGRKNLVIAGVETHICVMQTALDAISKGYNVHVVSDATSSRTVDEKNLSLERMRSAGVVITTTEALIFELLKRAGTDEFRAALELVKN
ncbi:MAG: hydrolase [Candidatus Aenigmarchaeota archaeon]|nr:hydrolase [Candidatus Aenigmarchaeota archaeon]